MKRLIKLILNNRLKPSKNQKTSGFTLIELLVGIIISGLVLLPLLGFMINIMETDRREQAKHSSEQEIQNALNYIARDLDQAIFIYDAIGLESLTNRAQLPTVTNGQPVLVFWKRKYIKGAIPTSVTAIQDDAFVYSLVVYYLIQDNTDLAWSATARIGRTEISDGVKNPNIPSITPPPDPNDPVNPANFNYINESDPQIGRSPGFKLFDLTGTGNSLEEKMNAWNNDGGNINSNQPQILVDYVDQTPITATSDVPDVTTASCPNNGRSLPRPDGATDENVPYDYRMVPPAATLATSSFYACVDSDSEKNTAQVFIRGNALARTFPRNSPPAYLKKAQSVYFPTASVQVKGRGLIGEQTAN